MVVDINPWLAGFIVALLAWAFFTKPAPEDTNNPFKR